MATRVIYRFEAQIAPYETKGIFKSRRWTTSIPLQRINGMPSPHEDHGKGIFDPISEAIASGTHHYGFTSIEQAATIWDTDKKFVIASKKAKVKLRAYEVADSDCILLRNQAMFRKDKAKRIYRVPLETLTR